MTQAQPLVCRLIDDARSKHGISTSEAARRAGMSRQRWGAIIAGRKSGNEPVVARPETLARMAHAVEMQPEDLQYIRPDVALVMLQTWGTQARPTMAQSALVRILRPLLDTYGVEVFLRAVAQVLKPNSLGTYRKRGRREQQ